MALRAKKPRFPRSGRVEWIGVAASPRAEIQVLEEVQAKAGSGLVGDHHASRRRGRRNVTLIQAEHFPVLSTLMGREITPVHLRRNVVVSGLNLVALKGQTFRLGEALLKGTGPCPPCERMEENLGDGGRTAAQGHAGITAVVLEGGRVRVGDSLEEARRA